MIKRIFWLVIIAVVLVGICGCSEYLADSESISSGEILTPEYMSEISQKLVEDKTTSSTVLSTLDTSIDIGGETNEFTEQSSLTSTKEVSVTTIEDSVEPLEDIVYWIGMGFYLFLKLYHVTNGTIRWYFIIGTLVGARITHQTIGKFAKKYIAKRGKRE